MMFSKAIVRTPPTSLVDGITTAGLGEPDYALALKQHRQYIEALESCELEITVMDADERYADSMFVEDTALLMPRCAVVTNPGARSRRGEVVEISTLLREFYVQVDSIRPPVSYTHLTLPTKRIV